jgi:predicted nucleic acid-binding Zn ribbon protein
MGVPLNDLTSGSNEDILRNMQDLDLDMGKIANVLRTLSEAAAAANANNVKQSQQQHQAGFLGGQASSTTAIPPPPALNQVPSTAGDILTSASSGEPKQTKPTHNRVDMSLPAPAEQNANSADHAYLLANKWMNAGKLAEMVKSQGECLLLLLGFDYMVS